jgi:AcrR family transcriptional regulator
MPQDTPAPATSLEGTAQDLIDSATAIFGQKGFDAASTRAIAAAAGTNLASISYHFGGKEGLRLACAREFSRRMTMMLAIAHMPDPQTPDEAAATILALVERMARNLLVEMDLQPAVAFALREITEGGPGADTIYQSLVLPAHIRLCRLWATATNENADSDDVKLFVFSMIGQVLYFRIGAPIVTRRMEWHSIGPQEADQIAQKLRNNTQALLNRKRRPAQ